MLGGETPKMPPQEQCPVLDHQVTYSMLCNCLNHALHEIAVFKESCVIVKLTCLATGGWRGEDGQYSSASDTDCENSSSNSHPSHTSRVRSAALSCLQVSFFWCLPCPILCLLRQLCLCAGSSNNDISWTLSRSGFGKGGLQSAAPLLGDSPPSAQPLVQETGLPHSHGCHSQRSQSKGIQLAASLVPLIIDRSLSLKTDLQSGGCPA